MSTSASSKTYQYEPVGLDIWEPRSVLQRGMLVVKVQPAGCPPNGTLGHAFVADATTGAFYGLVLENSLRNPDDAALATADDPETLAAQGLHEAFAELDLILDQVLVA
jgi:hypothetical protein